MSATAKPPRGEVCRTPLHERPDPRRRRCADHLDQLVLVPLATVRRKGDRR
ncbi:hypothetical protein [Pseudonocardia sp. EV170527-09]|uniref:hypothetical protein n=1 Tax=Pseudonocardia sp. EV170527-09 TaxID=2603411 RepID=UPI0013869426|nr:hypothetical protein [Pseudonocardia sp. EV170527-09]